MHMAGEVGMMGMAKNVSDLDGRWMARCMHKDCIKTNPLNAASNRWVRICKGNVGRRVSTKEGRCGCIPCAQAALKHINRK